MDPEHDTGTPLEGGVDLGGGDAATAIGPPGGASPLPPDGDIEFGGARSRTDDYDPGADPELNSDFAEDDADFDFAGEGPPAQAEAAPEAEPEPEPEPEAPEGESEEELRAFVENMDNVLRNAAASLSRMQTPPEGGADAADADAAPAAFTPIQLSREQLEEALDDPEKFNETLVEVQRQAVEAARAAYHAEAQAERVRTQSDVARREADRMFAEHQALDTPEIRAKCAMVAQTLAASNPELQGDIPTLMKYTARYMTARMRTHPHEFTAAKPGGLPPLPGTARAPAPAAAPAASKDAPPKPGAPAFAGGGVSARRVKPAPRELSDAERELHELKPEHAW